MSEPAPSTKQILEQVRVAMGEVPPAIEKAAGGDPRMVAEQARSSDFAMPPEDGALDPETRTLVYLAVALATSNRACTVAMVNKAVRFGDGRALLTGVWRHPGVTGEWHEPAEKAS